MKPSAHLFSLMLMHFGQCHGYYNAVYFPNWAIYGRNYHPQQLPASHVTHVLYAFVNLLPSGEVFSADPWADVEKRYPTDSWVEAGENAYGCVKQLFMQKVANRRMKTLLSIGGWSWSANFSAAAETEMGRATFARSSVTLMKDWGFDGIDIDWEYPSNDLEARDFVLLLLAVRDELDNYAAQHNLDYHFLLTIASPAGKAHYGLLDLERISEIIDVFFLMGYDYAGSWSPHAAHHANLYPSKEDPAATPFSTDAAVADYLGAGVPASKIVLGMPMYGRAFLNTAGLGQSFSGIGPGSWEDGVWDYGDLPHPGAKEVYDDQAVASFTYDEGSRTLISYDTPRVVQGKVSYVREKGLAGSMFWEASGDRADASLIFTSFEHLGWSCLGNDQNQVLYPDSLYDNIRRGLRED